LIAGFFTLLAVTEFHLEVPTAVENSFDKDGGVRDDERDGHTSLKSGHAQSGQHVVTPCSPHGKCREALAERDDAADVVVGALLTRMRGDVLVQAGEVPDGEWRKDDLHKVLLSLARRAAARLNAFEDRICRNALRGIGEVFLMSWHHFLTKPAFHGRVPL
jgi:hypothetical protein